MDRTRESRRSSFPSAPNPFPRRQHRTILLRDSSDEGQGQVELQEPVRLRAIPRKRDRDRDSFNRIKRRKGSHSHRDEHEGDPSTEESVGNEQHHDLQPAALSAMHTPNNASDQHRRRSPTPARPLRPTPKITDEMIGAIVPRKARSASVKRPHESVEEQIFRRRSNSPGRLSTEAASPSSSNVSVGKKMKASGPKTRIPKTSKSFSSTQEDIEIEIAELLYGLRTSKNQESSSQNLEPTDTRPTPITDAAPQNKKVEDNSSSTQVLNNLTAESVRIESEQPAKVDNPSPGSAKISGCHDDNAAAHETGSSEAPNEDIEEDNLNSCSKSKLDVDKQDPSSTRAMPAVPEANSQRVDKFEIDLMAPPPMGLSPERDELSRGDFASETKALAPDVEMKREDSIKIEDKVERRVKQEKMPEEIDEVNMDAFKEKWGVLKFDLEKPSKHNDIGTSNKLEEQDRKKEQPTKSTNLKVEKAVQSSSVPLSTAVPQQPSSLSPLGYMLPSQTVVKMDKTTGSTTAPQHVSFVLSQNRPKRCATHHYIAGNIFLHQQFAKMNPLLPAAVGSGSLCSTKPNNANGMLSAENMAVGKQSKKHLPGLNQNAAQEKGWAASSDPSLAAFKSSGIANPVDSTQRKQLVLHQGPHSGSTGNLVHGPAFLFPPGQHQASVITAASQAGGVNSTISASSSSKSQSSAAGSLGTSSTLPAVAAAMSFSYPNLAVNDAPYVTIVQNNGYPFPFSTPLGASAAIRGGSPAQATPVLNGPFYSSQMFHPIQHPHQHSLSQAWVQPGYLNASMSSGSSSSHKQPQETQVDSNNVLTSSTMQLRQSQKQHTSLSRRKHETEMGGENAPSVASRTSYPQKNVFGQNYTIPAQPLNLSFRPSATSDSVGGNNGNFGDKQQQALKGGGELIPSQAFAISFAAFNGTSVPSNLNFSCMAPNPVIFPSLPEFAWEGYQAASTSHTTPQKIYSITEGKIGNKSSHQDDDKKATSGKPSTNGPTTLVFDNSSKNLNFVLSPMNENWPSHSISSTATTTILPLSSNASNSQQLLHLQKQHGMQQHQPAMATQYKASSTNTAATKFVNNPPVFSQNLTHCKSSNQASLSKSSGRTTDSQVHSSSIITSSTPTLKSFSLEQGRVLQGHTQICFGGNYISSLPPQGQQLVNNNQFLCTTVAGTPPNGGNLKPNPQLSNGGSSINTSQMQQTENSSAGSGQKSSLVCGRNVPSILSSCPSHLSELKY